MRDGIELSDGVIRLRPWRPADNAALVRYGNNRNVWINVKDRFPHPYTTADADDWIARCAGQGDSLRTFAIELDLGEPAASPSGTQLRPTLGRPPARTREGGAPSEGGAPVEVAGEAVGGIGFELMKDVYRVTAELGYWIAEPFWGRGLATAAVKLITGYAFERFPLERLQASVFEWNPASARVLEKAGFTFEARLRRNVVKDGRVGDSLVYARLRDENQES